jgi:prevent-host-death family protein
MDMQMTVSEARSRLAEIVELVADGEEVTLTRHGVAAAVVVRPDTLRVRRADSALDRASEVGDLLLAGAQRGVGHRPRLSGDRADALVAEVSRSRARR